MKHLFHAVAPCWTDGKHGEPRLLEQCWRHVLDLALENGVRTIGVPLPGTGPFGVPEDLSLEGGLRAVNGRLRSHPDADIQVTLVVRGNTMLASAKKELQLSGQKERTTVDLPDGPFALATEEALLEWERRPSSPEPAGLSGMRWYRTRPQGKRSCCTPGLDLKKSLRQHHLRDVPPSFEYPDGRDARLPQPQPPDTVLPRRGAPGAPWR